MINNRDSIRDYLILLLLPIIFLLIALIVENPVNLIKDLNQIVVHSDILLVDYFEVVGIGGTLLNVSLVTFFSILMIKISKKEIDGITIASIYTIMGFAFMGKNIINIVPIYLGGYLYSVYKKEDLKDCIICVIFATTLAPLVSEIIFNTYNNIYSLILGISIGILIGFIVNPLARNMCNFHLGYNLYNIGFVGGIIGTVLIAVLKVFNINFEAQSVLSSAYHNQILYFLISVSILFILFGLYRNKGFKGYKDILKETGRAPNNFKDIFGINLVLINMGILGIISTLYVIVSKGVLNGPTVTGILTIIGFAASGKHPRNVLPILMGVFLAGQITSLDGTSTGIIIAALFGTTLSPVAGEYGILIGILAGFLHPCVGSNIVKLHSGVHLYNNGFSGGIVSGFLVPIINSIKSKRQIE